MQAGFSRVTSNLRASACTPRGALRTLVVLLVAAVVSVSWGPREASAALDGGAQYEGSSSVGGQVRILISADRLTADITFDYPPDRLAATRAECPLHAEFLAVPIQEKFMKMENVVAGPEVISFVGFFDSPFFTAASGTFSVTPAAGKPCLERQGTWRAGVTGLQLKGAPAGAFTTGIAGDVFRLGGGSSAIGTAQLTTNDVGNGLTALSVNATVGACQYKATLNAKQLMYDVGATFEASDSGANLWSGDGAADSSGISMGMGMVLGPQGTCPAIAVYFTANKPPSQVTPVPTATATQAPSATPAATPVAQSSTPTLLGGKLPASGFGLGVFSGGSNAGLVTASGCPTATAVYFVTNASGDFVSYVPGAAVAVVNAQWNAMFATGIPANTPIIGKCS